MSRTNLRDQFTPEQRAASRPKIIAPNTFCYQDGDCTVIRLHSTDIVRELSPGRYRLDSGGWRTITTKDRMQSAIGSFRLWQDKGQWFVGDGEQTVPYYDGMILPDAFKSGGKANKKASAELKLRERVKKFAKKLDGLKALPAPENGDCWLCGMRDDKGVSMGEHGYDKGHLLSHIKEGYLHGSLILNALKFVGYRDPAFIWQTENSCRARGENPHFAKNALKKYLYRKLGLVS